MIEEPSPFSDSAPKVRSMPQSSEAEQGLLCSIMRSPNDVLSLCLEKKITVEHFYTAAFGILFAVMLDLWNARKPLEFVIIARELQTRGQLEEVGGAPIITELSGYVGTAENAGHYVDIRKTALIRLRFLSAISSAVWLIVSSGVMGLDFLCLISLCAKYS